MNVSLFWSGKKLDGDTFDTWRTRVIDLSYFHEVTLFSQVKFKNTVYLYTYQTINKELFEIPDEINIVDANEFFPAEEAYAALERGHSIAHISDLVRLKSALGNDAIVMDIDNIIINEFPDIDCFTSTLIAKKTGGMAMKFGKNHPPFIIRDNSWDGKALSVFPIKIHSKINKEINKLVDKIRVSLSTEPSTNTKGWNYVMWSLKDIANSRDDVQVMKPIQFCPVPAWKRAGNCYSLDSPTKFDGESSLFGNLLPSLDEIFTDTYAVQHFFESAFKNSDTIGTEFWSNIKVGSLLNREMELLYGEDWRKQRIKDYSVTEEISDW